MSYTLKVLEDKEFDALPYKHVKESLGLADPKKGIAYVRNTHWGEASKAINLLTIQHELEELVAKTSPHEEDGIRYKKGGVLRQIIPAALAFVPGIGPLLSAASSVGMNQYAQSRHPEELGEPSLGSALMQAGTAYLGAQVGQGAVGGFMQPGATATTSAGQVLVKPTLMQQITGAARGAVGAGAIGNVSGGTPSTIGPNLKTLAGFKDVIPAGGSTSLLSQSAAGGGAASAAATAAGGASKNIFAALDNPMAKLGLGAMSMSALPTSLPPPTTSPIISKWLTSDTVTKAGAQARTMADINYGGEFQVSKETQAYTDVMEKDIRKAYKQRIDDMDKMAAATNSNWGRSGERLDLYRRMATDEQEEVDKMRAEWILSAKQQHSQQQYNYILGNLNTDEATKRDLLYGELSDVMWKYNMQQEDLMNFRKIAADAGMYMTAAGMGVI